MASNTWWKGRTIYAPRLEAYPVRERKLYILLSPILLVGWLLAFAVIAVLTFRGMPRSKMAVGVWSVLAIIAAGVLLPGRAKHTVMDAISAVHGFIEIGAPADGQNSVTTVFAVDLTRDSPLDNLAHFAMFLAVAGRCGWVGGPVVISATR